MIRFEQASDGSPVAFLAGRPQDKGTPFSSTRLQGDSLYLTSNSMDVRFRGVLSAEEPVIRGTWTQGENSGRLILTPARNTSRDASATADRPQHPERPYPYRTEDITFESGDAVLAGTLSMPQGGGPHPAVVLLHGSGENERDYEHRGHKFFLVLADHLTRQGIAVLRYDMRGVGASEGSFRSAHLDDFARDAASALQFLKQHPRIDAQHVGLVGHSMGGMIAPRIHNQLENTAFLALLAPLSLPGADVLVEQRARLAKAGGAPPSEVDTIREQSRRAFEIIRSDLDSTAAASRLQPILAADGAVEDRLRLKVEANTTPWFRDFARYDPRPALQEVDVPVLALFGGQDLSVPPQQNAAPMRAALAEAPSKDVSTRVVDGLNHFMQPMVANPSRDSETGKITIAPVVMEQVTAWMQERMGS